MQEDFGQALPSLARLEQQINFYQFLEEVKRLYYSHRIKVAFFVDQVNDLYGQN